MALLLYPGQSAILQPKQTDAKGAVVPPVSATYVSLDPTKVFIETLNPFTARAKAVGVAGDSVTVNQTVVGSGGPIVTPLVVNIVSPLPNVAAVNTSIVRC